MQTVTIVGVGALGSHVVQFLRNEAVTLRVIDFDRVEHKNVLSQFHGKVAVGKGKVQALTQAVSFMFGVKIEGVPHKLTNSNQEQLLGKAALVIDCLDNGASRRLVQDFVRATGTPCLHGALSAAGGGFGRVVWDDLFVIDDEDGAGAATCEGGDELPFIGMVSTVLAKAAQDFLRHGQKHSFQVFSGGVTRL